MRVDPLLAVAVEASADRLAADVVRAADVRRPVVAVGGRDLAAAGAHLVADLRAFTAMGTVEVLARAPAVVAAAVALYDALGDGRPAAALLVDGPDFNLPLAAALSRRGVPVVYYVAPQVWAWRRGRVRALRERVRRLAVVLPFEEPMLRASGVDARFVGHPLLDAAVPCRAAARAALGLPAHGLVVAVAPGSRPAEVARVLPACLDAARRLAPAAIVVPVAPSVAVLPAWRDARDAGARLVPGPAGPALAAADVAFVCSGTATLECVLARTPPVVVYRAGALTALVARALVRTPFFGLPNLVLGRAAFPECLQGAVTGPTLARAAQTLLARPPLEAMDEVHARLGTPGASARVAAFVDELAA